MKIDKNRLLLEMARARITDAELCERSGIARPTFKKIKSGSRNPKPVTLGKLAYGLGIDPAELIIQEAKEA